MREGKIVSIILGTPVAPPPMAEAALLSAAQFEPSAPYGREALGALVVLDVMAELTAAVEAGHVADGKWLVRVDRSRATAFSSRGRIVELSDVGGMVLGHAELLLDLAVFGSKVTFVALRAERVGQ